MNKCKSEKVIYEAIVSSEKNEKMSYIGSTRRPFKNRLYEHRASFPKPNKKKPTNCTQLANYIWKLYKKTKNTQLSGKYSDRPTAYSNQTLCAHYVTQKDCIQQTLTKEKSLIREMNWSRNALITIDNMFSLFLISNYLAQTITCFYLAKSLFGIN